MIRASVERVNAGISSATVREIGLQPRVTDVPLTVLDVLVQPDLSAQAVSADPLMTIMVEITRDE